MEGKLIVIEGMDGSGKNTQTKLLIQRMNERGYKTETISFPRYETKWGRKIKLYLKGEYGGLESVDPLLASSLFAMDREEASAQIKEWLSNGTHVISDRYMESNLGHQGAKLTGQTRKNLIDKLIHYEHEMIGIPRSDLVVYLDLPVEETAKAIQKRNEEKAKLEGKIAKDIHEEDVAYQAKVRETYLEIAGSNPNWAIVNSVNNNNERYTQEFVSDLICSEIQQRLGIDMGFVND